MERSIAGQFEHIRYLIKGSGLWTAGLKTASKLISFVFEIDTAYIAVRYIHDYAELGPVTRALMNSGYSSTVLRSVEDVDALGNCPTDKTTRTLLRRHFAGGPNQVIFPILRRMPDDSGFEVLGFTAYVHREFSYWHGRFTGPLPPDCLYGSDFYVAPEHRGQRLHFVSSRTMLTYCRDHGIATTVGFIKKHNTPSIIASQFSGADSTGTLNGVVRRTTLFGGLFEHITPPEVVSNAVLIPCEVAKSMQPANLPTAPLTTTRATDAQ